MTSPAIAVASTNNTAEMFHWMNTQQLFLLVYVVSVMHALQQGYTDKAESYAKKALHLIDKQRSKRSGFVLRFLGLCLFTTATTTFTLDFDRKTFFTLISIIYSISERQSPLLLPADSPGAASSHPSP